jgi:hypothetical protein
MFKAITQINVLIVIVGLLALPQNTHAQLIEIRKEAIETSSRGGSRGWFVDGTKLYTYWGNQWLKYEVELPVVGTWTIGLSATNVGQIPSSYSYFKIGFYIDGTYISTFNVPASSTTYNEGSLEVQGISSGLHTFKFIWINDYYVAGTYDANIKIKEVIFQGEGPLDAQPQVTITSPVDGAIITGTITIQVQASDDNGISKVDFYIDGSLLLSDTTFPYEASWNTTQVSNGAHTVKVIAYDTINQTVEDSIGVTVQAPDNQPPTASASANPTSGPAPLEVSFTASASDPDGWIVSYAWDFGDGNSSSYQNPTNIYQYLLYSRQLHSHPYSN